MYAENATMKEMCSACDFNLGIECNSTILFCARNSDVNAMNYFYGMQLFFFFLIYIHVLLINITTL